MNESKHTPGPWVAHITLKLPMRCFGIESAGGRRVASYLAFDDHLRFKDGEAKPVEVEANAHLIAAAPEMLEALEYFCVRVDEGSIQSKVTYAKYKEIIAKAKGEP